MGSWWVEGREGADECQDGCEEFDARLRKLWWFGAGLGYAFGGGEGVNSFSGVKRGRKRDGSGVLGCVGVRDLANGWGWKWLLFHHRMDDILDVHSALMSRRLEPCYTQSRPC